LLLSGIASFFFVHNVANLSINVVDQNATPSSKINYIEKLTLNKMMRLITHVSISDFKLMENLETEIIAIDKQLLSAFKEFEEYTQQHNVDNNIEDYQHWEMFKKNWNTFNELANKIIASSHEFVKEDALDLIIRQEQANYNAALTNLGKIKDIHQTNMETLRTQIEDLRDIAIWIIAWGTILITLLMIVFLLKIGRSIAGSLNNAVNYAQQVAEGYLETKATDLYKDEIGNILRAMFGMSANLTDIINKVRDQADHLFLISKQVNQTAQRMNRNASMQAAGIEQTSASLQEMASSISQNNNNAKSTEEIALQSASKANEGGQAVRETMLAMQEIASKITMIEEIAYKTNILALNAAIEAARAGEHGLGFAVVASEVQKLAENSQTAAQEIKKLTTNSVHIAEHAGQLLNTIVPSIQKTAELVQEIAAASQEQTAGVEQINTAVSQLDQISQQNAAASEELASAAEQLDSQSQHLLQMIAFFNFKQVEPSLEKSPETPKEPQKKTISSNVTVSQSTLEKTPPVVSKKTQVVKPPSIPIKSDSKTNPASENDFEKF
jgi:methyl-accepting chemotaxis protein